MSGIGLGLLMYGVSKGSDLGWGSGQVLAAVTAAFALAGIASALSIHDAAAATIPSRRHHPHWFAPAAARVWHHPAANQTTKSPRRVETPGETTDRRNDPQPAAGADAV